MKTAEEYVLLTEQKLNKAVNSFASNAAIYLAEAQVYATLAQVTAIKECSDADSSR